MTEVFSPPVPEDALFPLQLIAEQLGTPGWLESSTYSPAWKALLGRLRVEGVGGPSHGIDVMAETESLFKELQDEKQTLTVKDNSEKMAYFRTATSLLEKLISLKERAMNVQQIGQFYTVVLSVMEAVLDKDQIHGVREKLKAAAGGQL